MKWKLFPFSLTGAAEQWYSLTVGRVEGDRNILKGKVCLQFFPVPRVIAICMEALSFQQRETELLGAAWARYTKLISSRTDLGIPKSMHSQHFAGGLRPESAFHLDAASGGSFLHKTVSEGKAILDRILKNTEYIGIYEDLPEEP